MATRKKSASAAKTSAPAPEPTAAPAPVAEPAAAVAPTPTVASISSALSELLALTTPRPATTPGVPTEAVSGLHDPAIRGAVRNKSTVTLGTDPAFTETAKKAAELKFALEAAKSLFETVQTEVRAYGKTKRDLYNDTMRCKVTTVNVPYVTSPDETGVTVSKHVQVICADRYSVTKDAVLSLKKDLGDNYSKLFVEETTKSLKSNAEDLFKKILKDVGLPEDKISAAMEVLFDTDTSVAATPEYEDEHKKLPEEMQLILNQAVTRAQPGLKFP